MNLGLLLEMAGSTLADRPAVVSGDVVLTYADLAAAATACAERIAAGGHDSLVYCGTNDATFPVALFGAAAAGVPFIPLNYRLAVEQLQPLVEAHPGALVVAEELPVPGADPARTIDRRELLGVEATGAAELPGFVDPDDVAVVLYTSGTSGVPKAALLRHRHLTAYVIGTVEFAAAEEEQSALVTVPPYHIAGMANLLSNVYAGRRIIYLDAFDAAAWLDTIRRHGVTQAMVVPTMLARVVAELGGAPADVPTLRTLSYGGSRMPLPVLEQALELFAGTGFVNAYGLTETSSTIALLGPDDHAAARAGDPVARERLGSVGRLLPGIEVEVRGPDGEVLPDGEPGLVFLRGEQVSGEYDGFSVLDEEGWFPTKDRGWIDAEGYLFIEGRADDTIIRGGENIAPAEIEDVLARHPGVADVVVVGVPDDEWGQRIAAVVVAAPGAEPTAEELQAFAREHLRGSKTPELVVFRDDLPRTPTGKLLRREVLADLAD
ncbi:MAG: AMP-binding protein [Acidimicrobiales bacterium]|nr:AMP-binding protein [Acidimicrobiales bacterium]